MDRRQISGAEKTRGVIAKVSPPRRLAEQLLFPDARRFQLNLSCPNDKGLLVFSSGDESDFRPM
jgi:hypothetical protein